MTMVMSRQERNQRRALLVRRWAAYRAGRRQREAQAEDVDEISTDADLLAELPDVLIG